jgi:lipopolysaccharide transport system ATP-binding protein
LIDEVLGVGDAQFVTKSATKMKEKIKSDKTAVLVSHNVAHIQELCDRAVLLDGGVTTLCGPTEEVLAQYLG